MTVAGDNIKSTPITNLDAQPIVFSTSGEGAAGNLKSITDYVSTTAAAVATSAYRMCRIPSTAKVKRVSIYSTNLGSSAGATLDVNVAFSDSTTDGSGGSGGANAGNIPTSALTGAVTTPAAYASANKMFGSAMATGASNAASGPTDITFLGTYTPALAEQPMWAVLGGTGAATANPFSAGGGFAQASGQICDPGGFFDFYVVIAATGTGTVTAGTIALKVDFIEG